MATQPRQLHYSNNLSKKTKKHIVMHSRVATLIQPSFQKNKNHSLLQALCDGVEETCFATDLYKYPRYWRQNEPDATLKDVLEKSEYKTCNCLKQKEICYRKNGCLSSKRYELILQNCLEAGCGDFCNSSGSVMGLNLAALLVAVIALMF